MATSLGFHSLPGPQILFFLNSVFASRVPYDTVIRVEERYLDSIKPSTPSGVGRKLSAVTHRFWNAADILARVSWRFMKVNARASRVRHLVCPSGCLESLNGWLVDVLLAADWRDDCLLVRPLLRQSEWASLQEHVASHRSGDQA